MYAASSDCDLQIEYMPSLCAKRFREFSNYDEKVLDHFITVTRSHTMAAQCKYKMRQNISYAVQLERQEDNQLVDIYFKDEEKGTPIFAYIHGGYWQMLDKTTAGSFVKPLVECGYRVLVADYNLCPAVTLVQQMDEMEQFFAWLLRYAEETEAGEISVAGHSAGAHLTTMLLRRPAFMNQTVATRIKSVFLISGVYDLRELFNLKCVNNNNILCLDDGLVEAVSPICWPLVHSEQRSPTKWHILVGQHESHTFIGQSRMYALKLKKAGMQADFFLMENLDHFNIIEEMDSEGSAINCFILNNLK